MPDDNIIFEEVGKDNTNPEAQVFKQPINGNYLSLFDELKEKCAPENYMNPYDPKKVAIANELYATILSTDKEKETEKLKLLRKQAMEELGIKFSTQKLYDELTKACNPKNFTGDSYDKERVDQANQLYHKILENADDIVALERIEEEANGLIKYFYDHRPGVYVPPTPPTPLPPIHFWLGVVIVIFFIIIIISLCK